MAALLLAFGLAVLSHARSAVGAETTAVVNSADGVNLRGGPGTSFPIVATLAHGTTVTITGVPVGDSGEWQPVSYASYTGFILAEYLTIGVAPATPSPSPATASPTPRPPAGGGAADGIAATVTSPDGLNLRSGPATTYDVLAVIPGGTRLQVVGRPTSDGWVSITHANKLGWVDSKFLTMGPAPGASAAAVATSTPGPSAVAASTPGPSAVPGSVQAQPSPAQPAARFIWPVASRRISTTFSVNHPGIDIDEYPSGGNAVVAIAAGTVTFAGGTTCCSYGLYVIVRHSDGYTSLYSHLSSIGVSEGQEVKQGATLGKSGSTGFSTGAHLHLELRREGVAIDPLTVLQGPWVIE